MSHNYMTEKQIIEELVDNRLSKQQIANTLSITLDSLKYKFKKYKLKSKHRLPLAPFKCTVCNLQKTKNDFYNKHRKKDKNSFHTSCKTCFNKNVTKRQQQTKIKAITYKGGSCEKCGYNRCPAALEFHHKDPTLKDPSWLSFKLRTFDDKFKKELDKCALLCANCHRELHVKMRESKQRSAS